MKRLAATAIAFILLLPSPALAGWGILGFCGRFFSRLFTTPDAVQFSPAERKELQVWYDKYKIAGAASDSPYSVDQVYLALAELPPEVRTKLFSLAEGRDLQQLTAQVKRRLRQMGLAEDDNPVLSVAVKLLRQYEMPGQNARTELENEIALRAGWPPQKKAAEESDRARRQQVFETYQRLNAHKNPQYQLRVEGNQLITPDGKRYAYTKAFRQLKIMVPYKDLIQHQSFEDARIVNRYRAVSWTSSGFDGGFLTPDGRYVLVDAHHRTKAYALEHTPQGRDIGDTLVPVLISPDENNQFFTATHIDLMSTGLLFPKTGGFAQWLDKGWSHLTPKQRDEIAEKSKTDPAGAIRKYYYESTGLTPP